MTDRKLLVDPDPDGSTFSKAFGKAARLPTQEDREAALEQSVADMRRELHRPEYQPGTQRDTRRPAGNGSGWANEVPISAPEGIGLIDRIVNALAPQPTKHVEIKEVQQLDPEFVREYFAQSVAKGKITQQMADEALRKLGLG